MNTSMLGADYPFDYLHAEIVKYFKERDKESIKQKQEWVERMKDGGVIDAVHKDKSVIHHIFAQVVHNFKVFIVFRGTLKLG